MKSRMFFLDNLRTFLILLVVVLHAGIVYEPILEGYWIVSDPDKSNAIGLIRMYLDLFVMFTLFFISGYFVRFSAQNKPSVGFILSKVKRIMIPWLLAVLILIPAYKTIFLYSRGLPQEPWFTYFHTYARAGADWGNFANDPTQSWLWFLPVLFLFQMIYLGLYKMNFLRFKMTLTGGVILTFVVGVVYSMSIAHFNQLGWYHSMLLHFQNERLLVYFGAFMLGTLCNKLGVFDKETRNKKMFIYSNVALSIGLMIFTATALNLFINMINPGRDYYFISPFVDRLAYYASAVFSMLSFLHVLIYIFRHSLNQVNKTMAELNRNSYAVYIIHMVILGLIALPLLHVPISGFWKFVVLSILTFAVSNALIYAFREIFQVNTLLKVSVFSSVVALLILVGYTGKKEKFDEHQPQQELASQNVCEMGIHQAIIQGDLKSVKQHIANGTDVNEPEKMSGSTPLVTAALFGRVEIAAYLMNSGADVNLRNNDGSTALHTAAFFCQAEIVEMLLQNGADKSIKNNGGATALESVNGPFEPVKGIYDYFANTLGPLGLRLDYEHLKKTRPRIAQMLLEDEAVE